MNGKYLFSTEETNEVVERSLERLGDSVERVDVSTWGFEKRRDFYFREIMPLSTRMEKDLTSRSDDRHAGFRDFEQGVLLTADKVFVAEEVLEYLDNQ